MQKDRVLFGVQNTVIMWRPISHKNDKSKNKWTAGVPKCLSFPSEFRIVLATRSLTLQWTDMICLSRYKVTALSVNEQLAFVLAIYSLHVHRTDECQKGRNSCLQLQPFPSSYSHWFTDKLIFMLYISHSFIIVINKAGAKLSLLWKTR